MTTAGCPLHGLCQLCGERLGVKWDREPQTATSYWACLECSELCWHCAENKASHLSGCPHHPDQVAERERIEILFQEREEEETAAFERGIERGFAEAKETR